MYSRNKRICPGLVLVMLGGFVIAMLENGLAAQGSNPIPPPTRMGDDAKVHPPNGGRGALPSGQINRRP